MYRSRNGGNTAADLKTSRELPTAVYGEKFVFNLLTFVVLLVYNKMIGFGSVYGYALQLGMLTDS